MFHSFHVYIVNVFAASVHDGILTHFNHQQLFLTIVCVCTAACSGDCCYQLFRCCLHRVVPAMSTHVQLFMTVMSVCTAAAQVTDAIKQYVEDKISKAVHNYTQNIKKIDVTLSARGGDTGTHGAK
jgi:hypothetical protein